MPALCEALHCDRCFLYLRKPETHQGRVTHCYRTDPKWVDLTNADWIDEGNVADVDPLMAIAFRTDEIIYVSDVETASPDVINLAYEQEFFKHRALIHLPIYHDGKLYAIVEPSVFDQPHQWTASDRAIMAELQTRLPPLVISYLELGGHEHSDPTAPNYPD
ncbi:MAG: GAF domain-containing protein [Cyanobacteria bacterium RM1_2_2]|nr:GAF domain-containing protein [Cyanobacteria bacterium RM1_2_2]